MEHALIPTIALSLLAAFAAAMVASWLRIPRIVGYLLAGIAVGPYTPGFVADTALASELAEIGVMLLMFGVGMHFSLSDLRRVWKVAVPGAVLQILVATLLGLWLARLWHWPLAAGLIFGLGLSCASTIVLLKALEGRALDKHPDGHVVIGWLLVEDIVCVLVLVLLPTFGATAQASGPAHSWRELGLTIAGVMLKMALFVALMLLAGTRGVRWLLREVLRHDSRELFTLAIVAVSVGIAYLASHWFHVSFALGAFLAGVVINGLPISQRIQQNAQPLQDTFAVLFFASVGMLFNPAILLERPLDVLAVMTVILVGKSLTALVILKVLGQARSTARVVTAGLAQIGEFSFILASLGTRFGLLPADGQQLILAGALLSIAVNPLLFHLLVPVPDHPGSQPA
jgi:CPA2 family monovalent cation:H+ antiporter-2